MRRFGASIRVPSGGTLRAGLFLGFWVTLGVAEQGSRWFLYVAALIIGLALVAADCVLVREPFAHFVETRYRGFFPLVGLAVALLSQGRDLFPQGLDFSQDCRAFFMAVFFRFVHFLH